MRAAIAIILGYVVMVIVVMLGIAATWFSLGAEFAFDDETFGASTGWSLIMLLAGFIAAIVGGITAAIVAGPQKRPVAIKGLVGLIIALGLLTLIMQLTATPAPIPEGKTIENLTFAEAGQYAVSPTWYNVGIIIVGAAGVIVGSKIIGVPNKTSEAP